MEYLYPGVIRVLTLPGVTIFVVNTLNCRSELLRGAFHIWNESNWRTSGRSEVLPYQQSRRMALFLPVLVVNGWFDLLCWEPLALLTRGDFLIKLSNGKSMGGVNSGGLTLPSVSWGSFGPVGVTTWSLSGTIEHRYSCYIESVM